MDSAKKIAIYLPNLEGGGVERAYLELAGSLLEYDIAVDLVLDEKTGEYIKEIPEGINTIVLGSNKKTDSIKYLFRYLKKNKLDLLLSGGDVCNIIASCAKIIANKNIRHIIGQRAAIKDDWKRVKPFTYWFWIKIFSFFYSKANFVVSNSEYARKEVVDLLKIPSKKTATIYNPVHIEKIRLLSKETSILTSKLNPSLPILLSIGSLTPRKNMTLLIQTFSLVIKEYPSQLLILGEGAERQRLTELVENLNLTDSVFMPGFINNPFPLLAQAKVFVSSSNSEGCPNVIQQALACNIPIVATDCPGGTAELLEQGKWGKLVTVNDPEKLAHAILSTLKEDNHPDRKIRAADFTPAKILEAYLDIFFPESNVQYSTPTIG